MPSIRCDNFENVKLVVKGKSLERMKYFYTRLKRVVILTRIFANIYDWKIQFDTTDLLYFGGKGVCDLAE